MITPAARARRAIQRWLHRPDPSLLARLAARGVEQAAAARARRPRSDAPPVPTLVVGSPGLGGAGKTPIAAALAGRLARYGPVALLGHGYGGTVDAPTRVDSDDAARWGDEAAAWFRAAPERPIIVGGRRSARHRAAVDVGARWIVCDDGLQDPSLPRTAAIAVVDATAERRVWPAGPLRERLEAMAGADLIWLHKVDEPGARPLSVPRPADVTSRYRCAAVELPDGAMVEPDWLGGRTMRPLCAIARPASFLHALRRAGARLEAGVERADHHRFTPRELADLPHDRPWITTAKDRVRLPADFPAAVLHVELHLETGAERVDQLVERLVGAAT